MATSGLPTGRRARSCVVHYFAVMQGQLVALELTSAGGTVSRQPAVGCTAGECSAQCPLSAGDAVAAGQAQRPQGAAARAADHQVHVLREGEAAAPVLLYRGITTEQ
eukprot:SM000226S07414  [mRNA]  locus=s226:139818:140443:+ [translate_table: standard]